MKPPFDQRGFTLIEVLVALAVVATALAAGLQASAALTRMTERQPLQWLGRLCAHNALVQTRLQAQMPALGVQTMPCAQANLSFQVELNVTTTPNPSFRRVQATALALDPAAPGASGALVQITTVVGRH
jgi:general secretion pathway protein I